MASGNFLDDMLGDEGKESGFFGEQADPLDSGAESGSDADLFAEPTGAEPISGPDLPAAVHSAAPARDGYIVLARKYRPQTFDEIVGQENVQQSLRGALVSGQISHAYLFSGPRGTGKTSSARILAKSVNCMNGGPRPDPCGKCASCRSITAGSSLDVIEIDAASNTGVDNIRELRSGVVLSPFSRFKVYIVDEVHMLSNQAFNALLKTLEEPPPQVIFILATTELHKVPETIVSRCQSFQFRRFSIPEIKSQLGKILNLELAQRGLTVSDEDRDKILDLVARNAAGGMRDAQVSLDQVLVFSRGTLDFEQVRRFLGVADVDVLDGFVRAMNARDTASLLQSIDDLCSAGQDLELFAKSLCDYLRDLLIVKAAAGRTELLNVSDDRYAELKALATELSGVFLLNMAAQFLKLSEEMKTSPHQRFALELAVIRLTLVDPVADLQGIVQRLTGLEKALGSGGNSGGGSAPSAPAGPSRAAESPSQAPVRSAPAPIVAEKPQTSYAPTERPPADQDRRANVHVEMSEAAAEPVAATTAEYSAKTLMSGAELLAALQRETTHANPMLHTTLIEFARVLAFSGTALTLGIDTRDKFGLAHLNRPAAQKELKSLVAKVTGCDVVVKIEPVESELPPSRTEQESQSPPDRNESAVARKPDQSRRADAPQAAEASRFEDRIAADGQVSEPVLEEIAADSPGDAEETPERRVYVSRELREKTMRPITGEGLKQYLETKPDLKDLVEKVRAAFRVDDSQIVFRARTI